MPRNWWSGFHVFGNGSTGHTHPAIVFVWVLSIRGNASGQRWSDKCHVTDGVVFTFSETEALDTLILPLSSYGFCPSEAMLQVKDDQTNATWRMEWFSKRKHWTQSSCHCRSYGFCPSGMVSLRSLEFIRNTISLRAPSKEETFCFSVTPRWSIL